MSDYKAFYEEQERIRLEAASAKEKAYAAAAEKAKAKDLADAKKTVENWRKCVALAAKDGIAPDSILCDNNKLLPSEDSLMKHPEASALDLKVDGKEHCSWVRMKSVRVPLTVYPLSSRSHYVPYIHKLPRDRIFVAGWSD